MVLNVSEAWRAAYPGAGAGVLVMCNVANPERHPELERRREALESQLRVRFADRNGLRALPPMQVYEAYFKRFRKTYHVLLQLESVAVKGKPIPRAGALVEAMFMAELSNLLLTAGHDLAMVQGPIRLDVSKGDEAYTLYNGQAQTLKAGDMFIADGQGVISSVIYGPDQRTRIGPETREVLYTVYAPPRIGAEAVRQHLEDIRDTILLVGSAAAVREMAVYGTE